MKANMRAKLAELAREEQKLISYSANYLWADSVGDREPTYDSPPDERAKWNNKPATILNGDGTKSLFRIFQPSRPRVEELTYPWDEDAVIANTTLVARDGSAGQPDPQGRPRFDPNPTTKPYLDPNPLSLFKSVFAQTEDQLAAEQKERIEGAIRSWTDKLVVDDPIVRISMKSRDKPLQQDRYRGMLLDPPKKEAIKAMYRSKKHPLSFGDSKQSKPSVFMHESTIEQIMEFESSLRPHAPEKWKGTRDFDTGPYQVRKSSLEHRKDCTRSIPALEPTERSGPLWKRDVNYQPPKPGARGRNIRPFSAT